MERNERTAERFISLLRERMEDESGRAIVLKLVSRMDGNDASELADECEDMVRFRDYLSEGEAHGIMRGFVNFDGSKGAHWDNDEAVFRLLDGLGIDYEAEGEYNRWAFLAVMNMIWSDEWGVLRNYASADQEARVCAELAVSRLEDRDRVFSVRRYFEI